MSQPGAPDPLYVASRRVLLDVLEALGPQRDAVILVGAHAVYLHTGAVELAVAEFTSDADLTLDPSLVLPVPEISAAMTAVGFDRGSRVGAWLATRMVAGVATTIEVDLMVPAAVGGAGRRAARLAGHTANSARKARGLEAALIDKRVTVIPALDPGDTRAIAVAVAGPAALIVSKLHKIQERLRERTGRRVDDKDALDVLRLLRAVPTTRLAATFATLLEINPAADVTREAVSGIEELFGDPRAAGSQMAARAAGPLADPDEIAASSSALARDLVEVIAVVLQRK